MKIVKSLLQKCLLALVISTALISAQAADRVNRAGNLETFQSGGVINSINSVELVANGKQYRFDTSVQFMRGSLKQTMRSLQAGDLVLLKGFILNDVRYIDTISVVPSGSDA